MDYSLIHFKYNSTSQNYFGWFLNIKYKLFSVPIHPYYNNIGYNSSTFDKLISESEDQYANDSEKRWDALVKAEKVLMNDQATIPLYQSAKSQLLRINVNGIRFNTIEAPYDFKNAYIKYLILKNG